MGVIKDRNEFETVLRETIQKAETIINDCNSGKMPGYAGPSGGHRGLEIWVRWCKSVEDYLASGIIPDKNTRNSNAPVRMLVDNWDPEEPFGGKFMNLAHFWIYEIDNYLDLP